MARITIVDYRPEWPAEFQAIAGDLQAKLGERAVRIDHIGSTSVPGLAAKNVIDLQVTVACLDDFEPEVDVPGYTVQRHLVDHVPPGGDPDPAQWRKRLLNEKPGERRANIHIREAGRANQRYPILFRDYLRAHPDATETYRQIKVALARLHPDDVDAYYDIKDPACDLIIQAAEAWATQTGWNGSLS